MFLRVKGWGGRAGGRPAALDLGEHRLGWGSTEATDRQGAGRREWTRRQGEPMAGPFTGDKPTTSFSKGSIHAKHEAEAKERDRVEAARRRFTIVLYYRDHLESMSMREAAEHIQEACASDELPFDEGPSHPTLWRWLKKAEEIEERGEDLSLFHFLEKSPPGRAPEPIDPELEEFMDRQIIDGSALYATDLHEAVEKKAEELGVDSPSLDQVRRYIDDFPMPERLAGKYGRRAAYIDAMPRSTLPADASHQMWLLDETPAPVNVREADPDTAQLVPVRPWIIILMEVFSRVILSFFVVPPFKYGRTPTYTSDDILGTLLGGAFEDLAPDVCRPFAGYLPKEMRWDKHKTHEKLADALRALHINVVDPVGEMPMRQGRIERINKTVKSLCRDLRGHVDTYLPVHKELLKEAPEKARTRAAGSATYREKRKQLIAVEDLYTVEEFSEQFGERVALYQDDVHSMLGGVSPHVAYARSRPDGHPGVNALALMRNTVLTVTRAGIDHTYKGQRVLFSPASIGETIDPGEKLHCYTDPLMRRLFTRLPDGRIRAMMRAEDWARTDDYVATIRDQQRRLAEASDRARQVRAEKLDAEVGAGAAERAEAQRRELLGEPDDPEEQGLPPRQQGVVAHVRAKYQRAVRERRRASQEQFDENGRRIVPPHLAGDPRQQIRRTK